MSGCTFTDVTSEELLICFVLVVARKICISAIFRIYFQEIISVRDLSYLSETVLFHECVSLSDYVQLHDFERICDAVNRLRLKLKRVSWHVAAFKGMEVYLVEMVQDMDVCVLRNSVRTRLRAWRGLTKKSIVLYHYQILCACVFTAVSECRGEFSCESFCYDFKLDKSLRILA